MKKEKSKKKNGTTMRRRTDDRPPRAEDGAEDGRLDIEKCGTMSVERLSHFSCPHCKQWWTVGDAPRAKKEWYCPQCGVKALYRELFEQKAKRKKQKEKR